MPTNPDKITAKDILISYLEYLTIDVSDLHAKPWLMTALLSYATIEMSKRNIGLDSGQVQSITSEWFSQQ